MTANLEFKFHGKKNNLKRLYLMRRRDVFLVGSVHFRETDNVFGWKRRRTENGFVFLFFFFG
jgi:hypothetical protein